MLIDLPWRLVLVGDGEARPAVEAMFAPFGERVEFVGAMPLCGAGRGLRRRRSVCLAGLQRGLRHGAAGGAGGGRAGGRRPRRRCGRRRRGRGHRAAGRAALARGLRGRGPLAPGSTRRGGGPWARRHRRACWRGTIWVRRGRGWRRRWPICGCRHAHLPDPPRQHELERGGTHPGADRHPAERSRAVRRCAPGDCHRASPVRPA